MLGPIMRLLARAAGLAFPALVAAAVAGLVARATGIDVPTAAVVLAALWLVAGVVGAAGLAALAVVRREWLWAAAMIVVWPLALPLYVGRLTRARRSDEPEP